MTTASICRIASIVLVIVAGLAWAKVMHAQEVVIQVAGPWSYVADPDDPSSVLLLAPEFGDHQFIVRAGSNVQAAPGGMDQILDDGTYKLTFSNTQCTATTHPSISLYELPSIGAQQIANIKAGKAGKRFAISLPKPCWYETSGSARMKLDPNAAVGQSTPESTLATWMALHYSVSDTTQAAALTGTNSNGQQVSVSLSFATRTTAAPALSAVLYNNSNDTEDYTCDSHSANYFAQVVQTFWGQPVPYYAFPELIHDGSLGTHAQSNQYDYIDCQYSRMPWLSHETHLSRSSLKENIDGIRTAIDAGKVTDAEDGLRELRSQLITHSTDPLWSRVDDELKGTQAVIDNERAGGKRPQTPFSGALLNLTQFLFVTGRVDCHAPQIDINNTVSSTQ